MCTEARHFDRLGQLGEFKQDSNTNSEQDSNTNSHSARSKTQAGQQPTAEPDGKAPQSREQSFQQANPSATKTGPGQSSRPAHIRPSPISHAEQRKGDTTRAGSEHWLNTGKRTSPSAQSLRP